MNRACRLKILREGNHMKKRIAAGFLLLCLLVISVQGLSSAEALVQDRYEDWLWEPYTEEDPSMSTGQVTRWACVTFGSYPQTEIGDRPRGFHRGG